MVYDEAMETPHKLLSPPATGYSPSLRMTLNVGELCFDVAAQAPNFVRLRDPEEVGPATATLVTEVDDDVRTVEVELPDGIDPSRAKQTIVR